MQRVFSQLGPPHPSSACRRPSSGRCFSGVCVCRCPLHLQLAAAGGAWMPSVTTSQHAHALGCCVPVAGLLRGQQPVSMPLPLAPAACRCRRGLDALGDHVAACPRSGVLRSRGGPLERAAACVCREAGATVQQHVLLRDLNVEPGRLDERRIEVIANGHSSLEWSTCCR